MELDHATVHTISLMRKVSRTLGDELLAVAAVQELAGVIARNDIDLGDEECAILIGVGAVLMRLADAEMKAHVQAALAISNAQPR